MGAAAADAAVAATSTFAVFADALVCGRAGPFGCMATGQNICISENASTDKGARLHCNDAIAVLGPSVVFFSFAVDVAADAVAPMDAAPLAAGLVPKGQSDTRSAAAVATTFA